MVKISPYLYNFLIVLQLPFSRMIIPSRWVREWLLFTHFKIGEEPGRISMLTLLKQDKQVPGGWRPKKNLIAPSTKLGEEKSGHYR